MRSAKFVGFALPPIRVDAEGEPLAENARTNVVALTEVPPSSRSFSLMCARPVFSHRPERAAVALGGSLLRRPTSAMGVRHSIGNLHIARPALHRSARRCWSSFC